jgi:hypothetical protein
VRFICRLPASTFSPRRRNPVKAEEDRVTIPQPELPQPPQDVVRAVAVVDPAHPHQALLRVQTPVPEKVAEEMPRAEAEEAAAADKTPLNRIYPA